jgi:glycosyltransferase involved in cell wall biosynthesis
VPPTDERRGDAAPGRARRTVVVSVVIPCWNAAPWIGETLASVLGQTGVTLEAVVVDDGSDDASLDAIRRAADERVVVIRQARQGASRARTVGTAWAAGRYVQYLDADDVLLPGALDARVVALEASGADVAYSDWVRYERGPDGAFRDGARVARRLGPRPDVELFTDAWWPPGALLYRRTLVERIGPWREDLPVIQDARFQLDAALCGGRFVHVPGVGLRYRVRGGESLSRRDPRAFVTDCDVNARDVHARWDRAGALDDERRQALLRVYGQVARACFAWDRERFAEVTRRLQALDPGYRPAGPPALRLASRLVGYERAERLALAWRRLKGAVAAVAEAEAGGRARR